jgi:3,4-dihydroxy 2-butanone 4-phosphate synthase/GTP cyclohydrolase II
MDLCLLAGLPPVAAGCDLTRTDGSVAGASDARRFARRHRLQWVDVSDIVLYRTLECDLVSRGEEWAVATGSGAAILRAYHSMYGPNHLAFIVERAPRRKPVVHVHLECEAGDLFAVARCGCRGALDRALEEIGTQGRGVLIYLRRPDDARSCDTKMSPEQRMQLEAVASRIRTDVGQGRPASRRPRLV